MTSTNMWINVSLICILLSCRMAGLKKNFVLSEKGLRIHGMSAICLYRVSGKSFTKSKIEYFGHFLFKLNEFLFIWKSKTSSFSSTKKISQVLLEIRTSRRFNIFSVFVRLKEKNEKKSTWNFSLCLSFDLTNRLNILLTTTKSSKIKNRRTTSSIKNSMNTTTSTTTTTTIMTTTITIFSTKIIRSTTRRRTTINSASIVTVTTITIIINSSTTILITLTTTSVVIIATTIFIITIVRITATEFAFCIE